MNLVCADAQSVMNGDNTKFIERSSLAGFCMWIFTIRRLYHWTRCRELIDLQRTFLFNRRACHGSKSTHMRDTLYFIIYLTNQHVKTMYGAQHRSCMVPFLLDVMLEHR